MKKANIFTITLSVIFLTALGSTCNAQCPDVICTTLNITSITPGSSYDQLSYSYEIKNIGTDTLFVNKVIIQNYVSPDSSKNSISAAGGTTIFTIDTLMPGETFRGRYGAYPFGKFADYPYLVTDFYYNYKGHIECNTDNNWVIKKAKLEPPVVTQFTADVTVGVAPLTVTFTDQSSGTPTAWSWDFNNDKTTDATTQNASYTYDTPGTYAVKLKASKVGFNDSITKTSYIVVKSPSTGMQKTEEEVWMVYPNPTDGKIKLNFGEQLQKQNTTIEIIDNTGRIVFSKTLEDQTSFEYDFTGYKSGTFIVKAITGKEVLLKKIVIR